MKLRSVLNVVATYVVLVLLVLGFAVLRGRTQNRFAAETAPETLPENGAEPQQPQESAKPFFSLSSQRTFGTQDRTRVWLSYQGIDQIDFRIYRVKDPVKFFKQLENPHQVGKDEEQEVAKSYKRSPTFLEKLRAFKNHVYTAVRDYVRAQLHHDSRKRFNQRFRANSDDDERFRTPLNVSDYARVPLLNPDQMVRSWREQLPPLEDDSDRRRISLGRQEKGVYLIEAVNGDLRAYCVAIVTDLLMVQKTTNSGQLLAYVVDRQSGAPRENIHLEIDRGKDIVSNGKTDQRGIFTATIPRPKPSAQDAGDEGDSDEEAGDSSSQSALLMMATSSDDFAISDLDSFYFSGRGGDEGGGGDSSLTSYIYTDRPVYRPNQKVYFKGILRKLTDKGYQLPAEGKVSVTIQDPDGGQIFERELSLSPRGTFSGDVDLADDAPLGSYSLTAALGDDQASGSFDVQEYKKPEFKTTVSTPQKFVNAGDHAKFTVSASYFFGAPVARAQVKYYIYKSRAYEWNTDSSDEEATDDEFGASDAAVDDEAAGYHGSDDLVKEGDGRLDASGRLDIDFVVPDPGEKETWDSKYRLEAQVTDQSRRMMESSASFTGVRGNTVATANPERYVYYQGDSARIVVHAGDHEGRPVATRIKLGFFERHWEKVIKKNENGDEYPDYDLHERELSSAFVDTNDQGNATYDYQVPSPGTIHIKTTVQENNRQIVSEGGSIWVADRKNEFSDFSYQEEGAIKLVPDKKSYRPGDTARVLALLPTDKAHLLVTTELQSVMTAKPLDSSGRAIVIYVPIEARYAPDVYLNVTYVRNGEMYTQDQMLSVPAREKLLNLQIISNKKEYKPRDTASYTILARNADGSPAANAEVSLGVVDESIYSVEPESVGDIRREFYGRRYNAVQTSASLSYSFTGYAGKQPVNLAQNRRPYQLADFKSDNALVQPVIRKIFKDTAFWQPAITTGADGKATVTVQLPDNLTTWRATARAITADTRVGTTTEKVLERKDVILRMATPRFFTEGDTVTLSAIVHNYLKADKVTQISIDVQGGQLLDAAQQTVTIPSQGDHRIDWRVSAPQTGELRILAKALTDTESDALETGLPIVPRGLRQTRGDALAISDEQADKTVTFRLPGNAERYSRSLRIEVAPSIAATLFGALDYLTGYPYGCTEQTMSQFLPTVIVAQTLKDVQTARIKKGNDIDRKARKGLKRLYAYQHDDGGWGWWKDDPTDAFMSAYVVDGFMMAKRAGYEIDDTRLSRGRDKLKAMLDAGKTDDGTRIDADSRAYMIYALNESGGTDARYVNDLFNDRGNLQPYGRALLALALNDRHDERRAAAVAGEIEQSAAVGDSDAHWNSTHHGMHGTEEENSVEATALSLKALARISPKSQVLPKAARWLVMNRKHGYYWASTKETAFAIYGLTDYLKVSQELTPEYTVEVYVNGEQTLTKQFTAADAATAQTIVIQKKGAEVADVDEVRIVKHGRGMLYVSSTEVHFTSGDVAAQGSAQLSLTRDYQRLRVEENQDGTPAWKLEALTGEIHSGDIIVSRLRVQGQRASYLMIEDPIPAGCEQIQSVSGIDLDYNENGWSDWYSSREFRDQRTVFFISYLDKKATYQYAMRVQVPGEFRVAPARVEQMYQPSVMSNTAGASLAILDAR